MARTNTERVERTSAKDQKEIWSSPGPTVIKSKAPAMVMKQSLTPDQLIAQQNDKIRLRQYTPLGNLSRVLFSETSAAALTPENPLYKNPKQMLTLDWTAKGPLVGLSSDDAEILIPEQLPEPPAMIDPETHPEPVLQGDMIKGLRKHGFTWQSIGQQLGASLERVQEAYNLPPGKDLWPQPKKVQQTVWHRSAGTAQIGAQTWECFQPVYLIEIASQIRGGFVYIKCFADESVNPARHTCLLWNAATKRGHFLYGQFEIQLPAM